MISTVQNSAKAGRKQSQVNEREGEEETWAERYRNQRKTVTESFLKAKQEEQQKGL